jgi:SAM-dependent methyltransferase
VFYDTVAESYAERFRDELAGNPLERGFLAAFAEFVAADGGGRVADVGCGPGRVTRYLADHGLDVYGVDLAPRMVDVARAENPQLRFEVGSMTALDVADGALAGLVAWYSIIHLPAERVPAAFAEFHRVLAPGGRLLLAFQVGDAPLRVEKPYGHDVTLDFRRQSPDHIAGLLGAAGFAVDARLLREAIGLETAPQAHLLAHKTA